MNARTRRRLVHRFNYLHTDFARRPAYSAEEVAAELLTDAELEGILRREQEEADRRWRG